MSTKTITIQPDSLKRTTKSSPVGALAELIWNALDADATEIAIDISLSGLEQTITIADNGSGIKNDFELDNFIKLGGSWKKSKLLTEKKRNMHGEKGEGRLKGFSLGRHIEWLSSYTENGVLKGRSIKQSLDDIQSVSIQGMSESDFADPSEGTKVIINDIHDSAAKKLTGKALDRSIAELNFIFSPFLITYHDVEIVINGTSLDPADLLSEDPQTISIEFDGKDHELKLFLWKKASDEQLYLCKENGTTLYPYHGNLNRKIKSYNSKYSAFLSSDLLNDETASVPDINESIVKLVEEAISRMNQIFQNKELERKKLIKDKWIKDSIYPYPNVEDDQISNLELTKRDVFDVFALQVQNKIKSFEKSSIDSKKLTFRLLAQALEENPKAIQRILNEVLSLTDEEQNMFADILDKMELSSIIKSAKLISDRLVFLSGLEELINGSKKDLREVDQLHKILENETWVFDENFTISISESRMTRVLEEHLRVLGKRHDDIEDTDITGNHRQRVDLMLSRKIEVKAGHAEHLVVELKRPSQKINWEILGQIRKYAKMVSSSDMFDKKRTKWKFIAISNAIDDDLFDSIDDGKLLRTDKDGLNIDIYIFTWAEIITNARARLKFVQDNLQYRVDDAEVRSYLTENYNQFLPESYLNQDAFN